MKLFTRRDDENLTALLTSPEDKRREEENLRQMQQRARDVRRLAGLGSPDRN